MAPLPTPNYSHPVNQGLLDWWSTVAVQSSGDALIDIGIRRQHGVLIAVDLPKFGGGAAGAALLLAGVNDWVDCGTVPIVTGYPVMVSAAITPNSLHTGGIFNVRNSASGFNAFDLRIVSDGTLSWFINGGSDVNINGGSYAALETLHVVGVSFSATSHFLYVNGRRVASSTSNAGSSFSLSQNTIGRVVSNGTDFNQYYVGAIYDVQIRVPPVMADADVWAAILYDEWLKRFPCTLARSEPVVGRSLTTTAALVPPSAAWSGSTISLVSQSQSQSAAWSAVVPSLLGVPGVSVPSGVWSGSTSPVGHVAPSVQSAAWGGATPAVSTSQASTVLAVWSGSSTPAIVTEAVPVSATWSGSTVPIVSQSQSVGAAWSAATPALAGIPGITHLVAAWSGSSTPVLLIGFSPLNASWSAVTPALVGVPGISPVTASWTGSASTALVVGVVEQSAAWSAATPALVGIPGLSPLNATWSEATPALVGVPGISPVTASWSAVTPALVGIPGLSPLSAIWSGATTSVLIVGVVPESAVWSVRQDSSPVDPQVATWGVLTPVTGVGGVLTPGSAAWGYLALDVAGAPRLFVSSASWSCPVVVVDGVTGGPWSTGAAGYVVPLFVADYVRVPLADEAAEFVASYVIPVAGSVAAVVAGSQVQQAVSAAGAVLVPGSVIAPASSVGAVPVASQGGGVSGDSSPVIIRQT